MKRCALSNGAVQICKKSLLTVHFCKILEKNALFWHFFFLNSFFADFSVSDRLQTYYKRALDVWILRKRSLLINFHLSIIQNGVQNGKSDRICVNSYNFESINFFKKVSGTKHVQNSLRNTSKFFQNFWRHFEKNFYHHFFQNPKIVSKNSGKIPVYSLHYLQHFL